jgi:hypothetical protein
MQNQDQIQTQIQTKKVCKEFYYRNCIKYPGMTKTIVIINGKILKPSRVRRSRTGAHGEDYYCLFQEEWQKAWVITFVQSNSGRRYVSTENVPDNIRELIEEAWINEDVAIDEIASIIAKLQTMNSW